jgi:hypothetical protein
LNSDIEEYSTRLEPSDGMSKEITNDWDYLHSPVFTLEQPGNYRDIAAYEFGVRGIGMWTIGQEDPQLWEMLVKHV